MTYAVHVVAKTFYRVYVEDEDCSKSNAEILKEAKRKVVDGDCETDPEIPIEDEDILSANIGYSFGGD